MLQKSKKKEPSASSSLTAGLFQTPFYPLSYIKVLIQIGHEPLPPFKSRSIFGREQFFYPNNFSYMRYVYSVEGIAGLYRGLGMKIISQSVATYVYDSVNVMLDESVDQEQSVEKKDKNEDKIAVFIKQTSKELTARCWGVIFSHPFHVMGLRCMAQFIGGETAYSSWNPFHNIAEIYRGEGIQGFFSGLIPRILFEASTIALTSSLAYLIKNYVYEDKEIDALIDLFSSLIANSVTYPLSLVSSISCISGSSIMAARPPRMALYASWIDVFKHLYDTNQLKRGSSSFFRVYQPIESPMGGFSLGLGTVRRLD
ncbi:mitochondrial carrier -like protein [Brachionus plicatilis]|uniref:Mitochondrial carrier-like protein n=1 Tax=Brachionus plicatilis TaxID=10195 RepID=A0A3M7R592_BRAPC|nr:mitochondrial carrier -like protein [Brachionus plicatilis]